MTARSLPCAALVFFVLLSCGKDDDDSPASSGGGGSVDVGTPNSIVSWSHGGWNTITSLTNWACLEGDHLTIACRPSPVQYLIFEIPLFTGPGTYELSYPSFEPEDPTNYAGFQLDDQYGAPNFSSFDSSGTVTITAFSATHGLTGTFDLTVIRSGGQTVHLADGVLDHVRPRCMMDGDTVFSYVMQPFVAASQIRPLDNDVYANLTIEREADRIVLQTEDIWNVPNPIEDRNTLTMSIPRDLAVGTYSELIDMVGCSFIYVTPTTTYHLVDDAANALVVLEHDTVARTMRGDYTFHLNANQTATGIFDLAY